MNWIRLLEWKWGDRRPLKVSHHSTQACTDESRTFSWPTSCVRQQLSPTQAVSGPSTFEQMGIKEEFKKGKGFSTKVWKFIPCQRLWGFYAGENVGEPMTLGWWDGLIRRFLSLGRPVASHWRIWRSGEARLSSQNCIFVAMAWKEIGSNKKQLTMYIIFLYLSLMTFFNSYRHLFWNVLPIVCPESWSSSGDVVELPKRRCREFLSQGCDWLD